MNKLFEELGPAVLQLSGGKDSITALHMAIPYKDRVTVHYCDSGDSFPHIIEYVHEVCETWGFELEIIRPEIDVNRYIELYGVPSDIIPVWGSPELHHVSPHVKRNKIQSAGACCNAMLWQPLHMAAAKSGKKWVIRGTKGSDEHVSVSQTFFDPNTGLVFHSPVWNMNDDDIYAYIKANDIKLPFQYSYGVNHSLDCMKCSAWGNTEAECQRVTFTKRFYPEVMPELRDRSLAIHESVMQCFSEIQSFHQTIQDNTNVA